MRGEGRERYARVAITGQEMCQGEGVGHEKSGGICGMPTKVGKGKKEEYRVKKVVAEGRKDGIEW